MPETAAPDPRVLRAIAHPTRRRILAELGAAGSLRAADIARELDIPANQASFHLRQLAKYGLVEEAPEEARDKRDRVWKIAGKGSIRLEMDDYAATPEGKAAVKVFQDNFSEWGRYLIERAMTLHEPERTGIDRSISDMELRLTPEERHEFAREMDELVERWRERTAGTNDGRDTYSLLVVMQDYPGAHRTATEPS